MKEPENILRFYPFKSAEGLDSFRLRCPIERVKAVVEFKDKVSVKKTQKRDLRILPFVNWGKMGFKPSAEKKALPVRNFFKRNKMSNKKLLRSISIPITTGTFSETISG